MKTTLVVADDHHLVRFGMVSVLGAEPALEVVGEACNGHEAVALARSAKPDLLLMDLVMPELNGVEAIRKVAGECPSTRCLALSSSVESRSVLQVMEAGSWGYVVKSSGYGQLLEAIEAVRHGQKWLSPSITDIVVQRCLEVQGDGGNGSGSSNGSAASGRPQGNGQRNGHGSGRNGGTKGGPGTNEFRGSGTFDSTGVGQLTPRERQVLQLLAEGHASKQIAAALNLSVKTIDSHRAAVMRKLELHSVAHLTKYAVREGITTLDY